MKNYPLTSIKVSDSTFQKLEKAIELSGKKSAEVRRLCLDLGLAAFERMGYDMGGFASEHLAKMDAIQPLQSLPAPKQNKANSSRSGPA